MVTVFVPDLERIAGLKMGLLATVSSACLPQTGYGSNTQMMVSRFPATFCDYFASYGLSELWNPRQIPNYKSRSPSQPARESLPRSKFGSLRLNGGFGWRMLCWGGRRLVFRRLRFLPTRKLSSSSFPQRKTLRPTENPRPVSAKNAETRTGHPRI
jgi:hypothetical protein